VLSVFVSSVVVKRTSLWMTRTNFLTDISWPDSHHSRFLSSWQKSRMMAIRLWKNSDVRHNTSVCQTDGRTEVLYEYHVLQRFIHDGW